ncbi:hypothetical protein NW731_06970 [Mycoplasmopsis felis]|uniref:hypothetical protein n=2 Tax=Mycoplasmopsis felis TaxID=33923 RepID=UPI0021E0EB44|nr:hypothetical protein [Mycoplasmopsis felis]MCU9938094.1 hypothetical protein [Mycoplasmopsis felis]
MNSKILKVFEDGSISSGAFNNVTNEMWKIINIVFGAAAGIMGSIIRNSYYCFYSTKFYGLLLELLGCYSFGE